MVNRTPTSMDAVDKETPLKPLEQWNGNETEVLCPRCRHYPFDLTEYEWARQYCGECGQRIDWSWY